jgi:3-hydroxyacyl-CoA dehydrogenase
MNRIAGADEQAGTDYAAQGDHRQVARLHFPFEAGVVLGIAG